MDFDLVIKDGTIIDGTGRPRFKGHVGIRDGKIAGISSDEALVGGRTLDASGLVVAPGFVDLHSHADWIVPLPDHDEILGPLALQGVTTVVAGQCGFSPAPITDEALTYMDGYSDLLRERAFPYRWRSMGEFLDVLEADGLLLNVALLVGHGTLRFGAIGDRTSSPTPAEMESMGRAARLALREGAFGLSAGLAYHPGIFATNDELLPLLRVTAEEGGVFAVHGRAYSWVSPFYKPMILGTPHNVRSVRELISLARQAGVPLQLSHQIFVGRRTWRTHRTVLRDIDCAADDGVEVAFDAFPYTFGNSVVNVVFPAWFIDGFVQNVNDPRALRRLKREMDVLRWTLGIGYGDIRLLWGRAAELSELEGLSFAAIATRLDMREFDAYLHVTRVSEGRARILLGTYSGDENNEAPLQAALMHPLCAFMTDTILTRRGVHNPASFGTFPRVLGRYSRDLGLFSLEEAVRRMTSFPAERIGLGNLGRVAEGFWADLVLFDPATVADETTADRPDAPPKGINAVLISGEVVARDGRLAGDQKHGRVLRR